MQKVPSRSPPRLRCAHKKGDTQVEGDLGIAPNSRIPVMQVEGDLHCHGLQRTTSFVIAIVFYSSADRVLKL